MTVCTAAESLTEHLPPEDGAPPEVLALAAKEIAVEPLEGEKLDQIGEQTMHEKRRILSGRSVVVHA